MTLETKGSKEEIYTKLKTKLQDYFAQGKISQLKEIRFDDAKFEALASGTGFKAKIACRDSKVDIELDLNFLLKAMRGQIEEQVTKMITKTLG